MMMEKEIMVAVPSIDFNFNNNCSSPYITAPSSPQHFPNNFFKHHDQPINTNNQEDEDFEFTHLQRSSLSADELFHAGKILPLNLISPSHPHHETEQKLVQKLQQQQEQEDEENLSQHQQQNKLSGKERSSSFSFPSCRKNTKYSKLIEEVEIFSQEKDKSSSKNNNLKQSETATVSSFSSFLSTISISKGYYRKWRIKDFLLFRSASEGRASDKDPLRKYRVLSKTTAYEDVTGSSFRSVENSGSVSKRRKPVSAHELHYTLNRAASEELKRKTMLPYKQGLLGCLGFNHGMNQISGRFGSFERS
ncbi:uncharacterized protein LOC123884016 [Trifolium pratense]|uniref:uncharacterized protein LOC123884016 n=1 Tax=Trifolium pratense TaxID=57577 RepID=UPI001E695557|nr:uncharacterized protein LOC123884016 [Trifolium pratense]